MVNLLLAVLSGFAFLSGFEPFGIWIGPFVGLALLYRILLHQNALQRFTYAFISGLGFFLPLLHWSGVYVGAVPWLILAFGEALLFSIIALLPVRRGFFGGLSFAALFTMVELLRMKFPFGGFGWGRVGFTQVDHDYALYPLIGITGITFLVAFLSTLFVSLRVKSLFIVLFFLVAIQTITLFGSQESNRPTISVLGVQGGVDSLGIDFNDRALSVMSRHYITTKKYFDSLSANSFIDLTIWPENSADRDPFQDPRARSILAKTIQVTPSPLLVGAVEQRGSGPINTSLLFSDQGLLEARYVKQDLAPFGEYIPVRRLAESIAEPARQVRDFIPGTQWTRFKLAKGTFTSFICFEILDDDHVRQGAQGSNFLIAQTNNATFGRSSQAAQQLQITRARAAELDRSFLAVSTTGVTAAIDTHGRIINSLPQFTSGTLEARLTLETRTSFAQRLGSGFWLILLSLVVIGSYRASLFSR